MGALGRASAAGVVTALALTGCAAGQRAQTAHEFSVVDGISADVGTIGLRNAGVTHPASPSGYPANSTATLTLVLVNNGSGPDQLVSVSTNAAKTVALTPAAPPSGAVATPAAATPANAITIPARGMVPVGSATGNAEITLGGLSSALVPGQTISVTFVFQNAGTLATQLAVKLVPGDTGGPSVDVSPSAE